MLLGRPTRWSLALAGAISLSGTCHGVAQPVDTAPDSAASPHGPSPVSRSQMVGEWTGLVPGRDALVTLRIASDEDHGLVAITEHQGDTTTTDVYPLAGPRVQGGHFSIMSLDGHVRLEGEAWRDIGRLGEGYARLVIRRPGMKARVMDLQLFYWAGDSWLRRVLELESLAATKP